MHAGGMRRSNETRKRANPATRAVLYTKTYSKSTPPATWCDLASRDMFDRIATTDELDRAA